MIYGTSFSSLMIRRPLRSTLFLYTTLFRSLRRGHRMLELQVACRVADRGGGPVQRSEEHTSELQSRGHLVCRLLLEKKNTDKQITAVIRGELMREGQECYVDHRVNKLSMVR